MYRHGLGDCLLITLPKKDGTPFYIMIDCGIVVGSPKPSIMEDVVESIIADTNGFVDILVVTHEHYDHVSGFAIAHELFAEKPTPGKLAAGQVWFAWTEDPNDALGNRLREERKKRKEKLAALVAEPGPGPEAPAWLDTSITCSASSAWRRATRRSKARQRPQGQGRDRSRDGIRRRSCASALLPADRQAHHAPGGGGCANLRVGAAARGEIR